MDDSRSGGRSAATRKILARPTITLPGGLRPGYLYWVDPSSEYVSDALEHRILIHVEDASEPGTVGLGDDG